MSENANDKLVYVIMCTDVNKNECVLGNIYTKESDAKKEVSELIGRYKHHYYSIHYKELRTTYE